MNMKKTISFDLDGTLVNSQYVDAVWLEKIPQIYAKKYNLLFDDAKRIVHSEYLKIGPNALEWYDIHYWLKKFDLDVRWETLLKSCIEKLTLYPEVTEVLDNLSKNNTLIIVSNAAKEFIEIEVDVLSIKPYFSNIFSAVSDFGKTKKDKEVYELICRKIQIEKKHIVHVGDNYEFDYLSAKKAGIKAYFLSRNKNHVNQRHSVRNLKEFEIKVYNQK